MANERNPVCVYTLPTEASSLGYNPGHSQLKRCECNGTKEALLIMFVLFLVKKSRSRRIRNVVVVITLKIV